MSALLTKILKPKAKSPKAAYDRQLPMLTQVVAGDISGAFDESVMPPPAWGKLIPIFFWVALLGLVGMRAADLTKNGALRSAQLASTSAAIRYDQETAGYERSRKALSEQLLASRSVFVWKERTANLHAPISVIAKQLDGRVQVQSLGLRRNDPKAATWDMTLEASGDPRTFKLIYDSLPDQLATIGWKLTISYASPSGNTLYLNAFLTPELPL